MFDPMSLAIASLTPALSQIFQWLEYSVISVPRTILIIPNTPSLFTYLRQRKQIHKRLFDLQHLIYKLQSKGHTVLFTDHLPISFLQPSNSSPDDIALIHCNQTPRHLLDAEWSKKEIEKWLNADLHSKCNKWVQEQPTGTGPRTTGFHSNWSEPFLCHNLDRKQSCRLLQFISHHLPTRKYLCWIKAQEEDLCDCGVEPESPSHLLLSCPLLEEARTCFLSSCSLTHLSWFSVLLPHNSEAANCFLLAVKDLWTSQGRFWIGR